MISPWARQRHPVTLISPQPQPLRAPTPRHASWLFGIIFLAVSVTNVCLFSPAAPQLGRRPCLIHIPSISPLCLLPTLLRRTLRRLRQTAVLNMQQPRISRSLLGNQPSVSSSKQLADPRQEQTALPQSGARASSSPYFSQSPGKQPGYLLFGKQPNSFLPTLCSTPIFLLPRAQHLLTASCLTPLFPPGLQPRSPNFPRFR